MNVVVIYFVISFIGVLLITFLSVINRKRYKKSSNTSMFAASRAIDDAFNELDDDKINQLVIHTCARYTFKNLDIMDDPCSRTGIKENFRKNFQVIKTAIQDFHENVWTDLTRDGKYKDNKTHGYEDYTTGLRLEYTSYGWGIEPLVFIKLFGHLT